MSEARSGGAESDFAWARLDPDRQTLRPDLPGIFLVQVKSDTDIGRESLIDPLGFFRKNIPEMGIPEEGEDVRAMVLRVNAEVPANPRHRTEVWLVQPGSTIAAGIQFKHEDDPPAAK